MEKIIKVLEELDGVDAERILSLTRPMGEVIPYQEIDDPSMKELVYNYIGRDNRSLIIYVGLTYDYSSNEALATVSRIREILKDLQGSGEVPRNWSILVGGPTAGFLDITELVDRDFFLLIIPTVLVGIYLVLLFLLGSVFTPLRLILTILMSVIITLGVLVITVQIGLNLPIYWVIPTLLFSTLMGLGMDYDIFLVSRIREEVEEGKTDEEAIVDAVERLSLIHI